MTEQSRSESSRSSVGEHLEEGGEVDWAWVSSLLVLRWMWMRLVWVGLRLSLRLRLLRLGKAVNLKKRAEMSRKKERGKRRRRSVDRWHLEKGLHCLVEALELGVIVLSLMREKIKDSFLNKGACF